MLLTFGRRRAGLGFLWLLGGLSSAPFGAWAQSPDCPSPVEHVPDPSVDYRPSKDVAPADLPGATSAYGPQDRVGIDLRVGRSKSGAAAKAMPVTPEIYAGAVEVKPETGEALLNGRPLNPPPSPCPNR